MPEFETSVQVDCGPEQAFDFLIRPANHLKISPPNIDLHFIDPPEILSRGDRLEFKVQAWGHVQHIIHEITAVDRLRSYAERQVQGPFKLWVHEHRIETAAGDGVRIIDRIEFSPPAGLLGLIITSKKILHMLDEGFEHRHDQLKKLLESAPSAPAAGG